MPIALRPRSNSCAISSRYGSLALAVRWPSVAGATPEGKKPVITEVVGFELPEPVNTKVAAFARDFSPQLPGERITIPDDLR